MKWVILGLILLFILAACTAEKPELKIEKEVLNMNLKSNDFNEGEMIPSKFTCQGEDINPQLSWDDVPSDVKSFALIFDDPDAPGGVWVHWLVKDIPASLREIKQNSVPGIQIVNSFGKEGYGGPCPPALHRYFFRLYALDVETLEADSSEELYRQVEEHAIAKAELMGKFEKS